MKTEKPIGKILWAVDALEPDMKAQRRVAAFLKTWSRGRDIAIEPVTVLSPNQLNFSPTFFEAKASDIGELGTKRLEGWLKSLKLPSLLAPTVLLSDARSLRSAAKALVSYAKQCGAEMIALNSHSRKGVKRLFLGSFAETLLLESDIPVFLIRPQIRRTKHFKRILYPADFSPASEFVFDEAVALALRQKAELFLFHQMEPLVDLATLGMAAPFLYDREWKKEAEAREHLLESMAVRARRAGVTTHCFFQRRPIDVTSGIVSAAKRAKVDLIAMASESGPIATTFAGSVTRRVIRSAPCPVWVIHPKKARTVEKEREAPRVGQAAA